MSTRFFLVLILTFQTIIILNAQQPLSVQEIKTNSQYLCGEGYGDTVEKAREDGLSALAQKIWVNIRTESSDTVNVQSNNGEVITARCFDRIVRSYSQLQLSNINTLVVSDKKPCSVLVYVDREEIEKMTDLRKTRINNFVTEAERALFRTKVDDALRKYYWAFLLLRSMPYPSSLHLDGEDDKPLLVDYIPDRINEILGDLNVYAKGRDGEEATLYFTYKQRPVQSVEFSYFDGTVTSHPFKAKDGIASIDIPQSYPLGSVHVNIEYRFNTQAQIDHEIKPLLEVFDEELPNNIIKVSTSAIPDAPVEVAEEDIDFIIEPEPETQLSSLSIVAPSDYVAIMNTILNAVRHHEYNPIKEHFTPEGWNMMDKLLNYGRAKIIGKPDYSLYKLNGDRVCCRSIKMSFAFENNHKTFTEDVTFTFNNEKKVECVAFGLGNEAYSDIFEKAPGCWNAESMMIIATFLENYKTAFALKNADYIESIFDDDAIIIVGNQAKRLIRSDGQVDVAMDVTYNKYSKEEYIARLRRTFEANEYVNINFADNVITKMGEDEWYAINISQDYYSSRYSDTGYLFLLVDVHDPESPIIHVRTWQPERDPNVCGDFPKNHPMYGLYNPSLF